MTIRAHTVPAAPFAARSGLVRVFTSLANRLAEWQERAEQRALLAGMDERMLKDIGVNSVDAARESSKPFWKA